MYVLLLKVLHITVIESLSKYLKMFEKCQNVPVPVQLSYECHNHVLAITPWIQTCILIR